MNSSSLSFENKGKELAGKAKLGETVISMKLKFAGYNSDIVEPYYWHLNFPYYTGKGFQPFKLEDHHYFSENSQFGQGVRQVKGGSIRAFQENLQQLIQLVKVHMFPLLKEVKEAHFYKRWLDRITTNDSLLHQELAKKKPDEKKVSQYRKERDEAILHIKDKWVNEVDGGRLWQMQRPASEQGLDFALLPQLFFGTKIDDPFERKSSLKDQLDSYIYDVDVTQDALQQLARLQYKFYTWLPTAIRETQTTFSIKVAALKQFYTQLQMYINFMKPLLLEISKKTEGVEFDSFYKGFESENPEFFNMLDNSYSLVRVLGVRKFSRDGFGMSHLEFTKHGFFIEPSSQGKHPILFGECKGKNGFIVKQEGDLYHFKECNLSKQDALMLSKEEVNELPLKKIHKKDLRAFPCMEFKFAQRRRTELQQTQQGPQQVPFMINNLEYKGWAWNVYEIASYREKIKEDNLLLLESFIDEIRIIKDELLYYVNDLEGEPPWEKKNFDVKASQEKEKEEEDDDINFLLAPLQGLGSIFSPLFPTFGNSKRVKKEKTQKDLSERDEHYEQIKRNIAEDVWKVYTIFKKSHGYIQY